MMSDFIKIKIFCYTKDTVKRMRRQVTDWEKIFANHISDKKDLYSKNSNPAIRKQTT